MADLRRIDAILADLSKEPGFRALGAMIATAENKGSREAIVKRVRAEMARILIGTYYPEEDK